MTPRTKAYYAKIQAEISRKRRELAGSSTRVFASAYLQGHCKVAFSRMHIELFEELDKIATSRAGRLAVAAPRNHAKSTIVSLAFTLWCALYGKENFIIVVSATKDQAVQLLRAVRDELTKNPMLLADFPDLKRCASPAGRPKPWRDNRIVLPNGVMISAYGSEQRLRGIKHGSDRPGLIVVDDIEDKDQVISEEQRHKLKDWFRGTLMNAGHPGTNVVVVGTVLHHDSLLANLTHHGSGWKHMTYQAVEQFSDRQELWDQWATIFGGRETNQEAAGPDAARVFFENHRLQMLEGTRVLWPEHEDYHHLMVTREREGRACFQTEKQNEPLDPDECIFNPSDIHYWNEQYKDIPALIKALGRNAIIYGACDPSMGGKTKRGDFTGIIVICRHRLKKVNYVIAADIIRCKPDEAITRILDYARLYKFRRFGVEANNFQQVMLDNLSEKAKAAGLSLPIKAIKSRSNKQSRISGLQPEVSQGRIQFHRNQRLLRDQLLQFPLGKHDDGPDALEMAVQVARTIKPRIYVSNFPRYSPRSDVIRLDI